MRNKYRRPHRSNFGLVFKIDQRCASGIPVIGQTLNISETGACIIANGELRLGEEVVMEQIFPSSFGVVNIRGVIHWEKLTPQGRVYGISFSEKDGRPEKISLLTKALEARTSTMKYVAWAGGLLVPALSFGLSSYFNNTPRGLLFAAFISLITVERIIETFGTRQAKTRPSESSTDWTIAAASFYYLAMLLFVTIEYFFSPKTSVIALLIGGILLLASFSLRWWGMATLGKQWSIHTQESVPVGRSIVTSGPYRHVRHPIYLGVILELTAIPLIAQTFFTFIFVLLINVPLQILRARLEERKLIEVLGTEYLLYLRKTPRFIPSLHSVKEAR